MASNPIEPTIFTGNVAIVPNPDNPELGTGCLDVSDILYTDHIQEYNDDTGVLIENVFIKDGGMTVNSTENATNATTGGAVTVLGGLSVAKSLYVGDLLHVGGSVVLPASPGSIAGKSFNFANNQASPQPIEDLLFDPETVRAAIIHISVSVQATQNVFALCVIKVIQGATKWYIATDTTGDPTGVFFYINDGQVSYTSENYPGFLSGIFKFIATTFVQ